MSDATHGQCPTAQELTALSVRADGAGQVQPHLDTCAACRAEWKRIEHLRARAKAAVHGDARNPDALRAALLAALPAQRRVDARVGRVAMGLSAAIAAAAVLFVVVTQKTSAPASQPPVAAAMQSAVGPAVYRASVYASAGADFAFLSAQPDEIVRLNAGSITVAVEPLSARERFRVITAGDEVEVHGTVFDVTAAEGRVQEVRVLQGRVEVRPRDAPPVQVEPAHRWLRRGSDAAGAGHGVSRFQPDPALHDVLRAARRGDWALVVNLLGSEWDDGEEDDDDDDNDDNDDNDHDGDSVETDTGDRRDSAGDEAGDTAGDEDARRGARHAAPSAPAPAKPPPFSPPVRAPQ